MTNPPPTNVIDAPIVLLPPSEGKAAGGRPRTRWSPRSGAFGALADRRQRLADALAELDGGDERLLGARGEHLARARRANSALVGARTRPAWERYTGVVWEHLDPVTLSAEQRRRIVVVSGLHGAVRGDDPVPDYRLKMGVAVAPFGRLAAWWRDDVSALLARRFRHDTVVDLLPQEHRAAVRLDAPIRAVSVDLVDPDGRPGGHAAKAAKGRLARALLVDGLVALDRWTDERFDLAVTR